MNSRNHNKHRRQSRTWQLIDARGVCAPEQVGGVGGLIAAGCAMLLFYLTFIC